jgi:hypothetical protein
VTDYHYEVLQERAIYTFRCLGTGVRLPYFGGHENRRHRSAYRGLSGSRPHHSAKSPREASPVVAAPNRYPVRRDPWPPSLYDSLEETGISPPWRTCAEQWEARNETSRVPEIGFVIPVDEWRSSRTRLRVVRSPATRPPFVISLNMSRENHSFLRITRSIANDGWGGRPTW